MTSVLQLATAREVFFDQQVDALERSGIECTVCTVPGGEQIDGDMPDRRSGVQYIRYVRAVQQVLDHGAFDLIHANYGLTAPFATVLGDLPVVLTLWGSDVVGLEGAVTRMFASRADAVTVRTAEMARLLGDDAAIILPSGVDLQRFRPIDRNTARERVGWDPTSYHVLFPYSRSYRRKNYPLAEAVVDTVRGRVDRPVTLETVSGVAYDRMPYVMNAADVMLLTSVYEGSPNTVKEAMACDVPVVATDVGDVRVRLAGVSPGGVGADVAELSYLVVEAIRSGERSNGRVAVRPLSWEATAARIIDIYEQVLG